MKRDAVKKDLIRANDGKILISRRTVEHAFGLGHDKVNEMLKGTDYKAIGRAHMYLVDDVVDAFLAYAGE